jgi:DNA invertase Pin-like site-specific DNA recombinase
MIDCCKGYTLLVERCEMPSIIGYLKHNIDGQNVASQTEHLKAAGARKIVLEGPAGKKRNRSQLDNLIADVQAGDTVVATSLYCIADNVKHLLEIVESLNTAGASLKIIDSGIDTSTPQGKIIRVLLGAITDFERQVVRERQAVGIARAKQAGRYKGRKPTAMAKTDEVLALNAQGLTRQKIADQLGIGVASVYRILKNHSIQKKTRKKAQKKPVDKPKQIVRKPTRETDTEQLSFF